MSKKDGRKNNGAPPGGYPGAGQPSKGNTERITLRLPPDLKNTLDTAKTENNRSLNDEIVDRLKQTL